MMVIRRIDELGRVVIPKDMRRQLGVKPGEELQLEYTRNKIVIGLPDTVCAVCSHNDSELLEIEDGLVVCRDCAKRIKNAVERDI